MSNASNPRLTIPRLAEAMRMHLQMREKFAAVMEQADLSEEAIENLLTWLKEWHAGNAQREIERKEEQVVALQEEIESLRRLAGEG